MKKILIVCIVLSGCTVQKKTTFPQTFEEVEAWFDEQHKPLKLNICEKN